ncbi:DNA/RNA non-specific endonuclease [Undibacterium sp. Xuan67W]|uniref:DNA/RNA non-specific endonuclease n=1 Tax=Undibacterium sp. Xuan67W TaxID=3413057 RepID=UPI003BF2A36C
MGDIDNALAQAVRSANAAALSRWRERTVVREAGLARISQSGIGAADPADQVRAHTLRESARVNLRFQERIIGPTMDFTMVAPGDLALKAAAPVARIVRLPGNGYSPSAIATGFMVAPGLLMTNHHVFPRKEEAFQAAANFGYIQDERGIAAGTYFTIDVERFYFADPVLDFALVGVSDSGTNGEPLADVGVCRLIVATGKTLTGMPVNIIQHPDGGPRTFAVTNNRLVDILPEGFLHYETDTLPGSSGSPLFNANWELLGVHHAGIPKIVNDQVITRSGQPFNEDADSENDVIWVANEGARISAVIKRLGALYASASANSLTIASAVSSGLSSAQRRMLERLLTSTTDPLVAYTASSQAVSSSERSAMANNLFSFNGPVTIHVYAAGNPANNINDGSAGADTDNASNVSSNINNRAFTLGAVATEARQTFDLDYASRTGYDDHFLGVALPLPVIAASRLSELYCVKDYQSYADTDRAVPDVDVSGLTADDPLILHYHHYSLAFNQVFRMCMWTASNVDYSDAARQDKRKRQDLGGEDWAVDPRVPPALQLKDKDIYGPGKRIDRGHIVRREDNCWGAEGEETAFANADSYHWTNCTPQHEAFNQENPKDNFTKQAMYAGVKGIWGEFESVVQKQVAAGGGQAVLFAGPVLTDDSIKSVKVGGVAIDVPTLFWKVVVVPASPARRPKLLAYGYVLSQADVVKKYGLQIQEELAVPPKFERMQKSIAEIGEMIGIVFPDEVIKADQFGI